MLVSCPKCHSIYEIPDDLIGKTGQNFRCQACGNVWHALREDALDYVEEDDEPPFIEAIPVSTPPYRPFPANKKGFTPLLNKKSGVKTRSSKELLEDEGDANYTPPPAKKKKEITLTSDHGTSFTISTPPEAEEELNTSKTPRLYDEDQNSIHATDEDRLLPQKSFKGYRKTTLFLLLLFIAALAVFLRRDIVVIYPQAETWYNKIHLSGLNNPEYLKFEQTTISEEKQNDFTKIKIHAVINNPSRYNTIIPAISVSGARETFKAKQDFLKAKEKTEVEIFIPAPENDATLNLTLGFVKP